MMTNDEELDALLSQQARRRFWLSCLDWSLGIALALGLLVLIVTSVR
jgi:hypothetical protein